MHAPDANDLDDTDLDEGPGDILAQREPSSSDKDNGTVHPPEPMVPSPTPAEIVPFSAPPASPTMAARDLPFEPEMPVQDKTETSEMSAGGELPTVEIDDDHQFSLDGPATRIGQKRKARDLHSILQVCMCGQTVQEDEKSRGEGVIQCHVTGCETVWVSGDEPLRLEWNSPLNCSITCNVLGLSTA
jgi:hypothetical protein